MSNKKNASSSQGGFDNVCEAVLMLIKVTFALIGSILYSIVVSFAVFIPRRFKRHDITGKVALVTGGGSGIGRLLIERLAKKGAKVITWDVNEAGNAETVHRVKSLGYDCKAYKVDLCDRNAIYRAADQLKKQGIKVDILVNNAGIVTGKNFLDSPDELVQRTFDVNILSHFWTVKAFLPAMIQTNEGHVVTVASMAGKIGVNKLIDYCSSKFAAVGFDESLRAELMVNKHDGVHTTVVCPYYINTGMFEGVKSKVLPILEPEYVADEILDGILMRSKEVSLPFINNFFVFLKLILSWDAQEFLLCKVTGVAESLEGFNGSRDKTIPETSQTERENSDNCFGMSRSL